MSWATPPTSDPTQGLDAMHLSNFVTCIREKNPATAAPAGIAHTSTLLTHLANIAQRTGETVKVNPETGRLAAGSPGADLWAREYEKGWEMCV